MTFNLAQLNRRIYDGEIEIALVTVFSISFSFGQETFSIGKLEDMCVFLFSVYGVL